MPERPMRSDFAGLTENPKGLIKDVRTSSQVDPLVTTTKSITSYEGCTCTDPQDIRISIEKLEYLTLSIPVKQEYIHEDIAKILLDKELYAYINRRQFYRHSKATL